MSIATSVRGGAREQLLFKSIMHDTDEFLNAEGSRERRRFQAMQAADVEEEVCKTMRMMAEDTLFENKIHLVSGHKFPDIIAGGYFGTEVKSTKGDKWESFGNSIFENTRVKGVEQIYLTFGKLGGEVTFLSKPYEMCISGVVVDHSPRYHIDMMIQERGMQTIFENLGVPYDQFRVRNDQVDLIARKAKENLKEGESLWWSPDIPEPEPVGSALRLFKSLDEEERECLNAVGCAFFPELFGNNFHTKYNRFTLWLIMRKNLANGNVRDYFSAGGRETVLLENGKVLNVPGFFRRIMKYRMKIIEAMYAEPEVSLKEYWKVSHIDGDRLSQWIDLCIPYAATMKDMDIDKATQAFNAIMKSGYYKYTYPNSYGSMVAEKRSGYGKKDEIY